MSEEEEADGISDQVWWYIQCTFVALQLQTQSALDSAILPEEDDNNGNPNQSSDGKAKDESGSTYLSLLCTN